MGKEALEESKKYDWDEIATNELSKIYQLGFGVVLTRMKGEALQVQFQSLINKK
jgi:hypothetical protein